MAILIISDKALGNGQKLPSLSNRRLRSRFGSSMFSSWGKIALFLEPTKANVYSRILKEGGARDVILLDIPFQIKDLYAGIEEVEAIRFNYILSEPDMVDRDQLFRYFVRTHGKENIHICSYYYIIECLSKVSICMKQIDLSGLF